MIDSSSEEQSVVQKAIEFFDDVIVPFYEGMKELSELVKQRTVITSDPTYTAHGKDCEFATSRHQMSFHHSTELVPNVCIMKIYHLPQMLYSYNSARPYRCEMSSKSISTQFGFGIMQGVDSTVTLEGGKVPRVERQEDGEVRVNVICVPVQRIDDIRARPEELSFELLLKMDEEFIYPFILQSMWCQTYDGIEGAFFCNPDHDHVSRISLTKIRRMIQEEKKLLDLI